MAKKDRTSYRLNYALKSQNKLDKYGNDVKTYDKFIKAQFDRSGGSYDLRRATDEQIIDSTQDFVNWCRENNKSEASIAHYLTGLATALGTTKDKFPCETIHRGQPKKGRDNSRVVNNRLTDANYNIGIRQAELVRLKGKDLLIENGKMYVYVVKGKGGKRQKQYILPWKEQAVASFFRTVGKDEYVFTKEEAKAAHNSNLHYCRRKNAQEAYYYYEKLLKNPIEREKMKDKLEKRFAENPKKAGRFDREKMDIPYVSRGAVKKELYEAGVQTEFDRLALMATSVLHLAHYREDVCVKNYMK